MLCAGSDWVSEESCRCRYGWQLEFVAAFYSDGYSSEAVVRVCVLGKLELVCTCACVGTAESDRVIKRSGSLWRFVYDVSPALHPQIF